MKQPPITHEQVLLAFSYDPTSGLFTRLVTTAHNAKKGDVAGTTGKNGYVVIHFQGVSIYGHHLAWFYVNGTWPSQRIDHKNGNRSDNRYDNLRELSHTGNMQNTTKSRSRSVTGYLGVIYHSSRRGTKVYSARIYYDKKMHHLGYFYTPKDAHDAYMREKLIHHPGFNSDRAL